VIPIRGAPAKRRWPWVTLGLIAINLAIYLYQLHIGPQAATDLFYQKGAVASKLSRLKVLSLRQSLGLLPTMFSSLFLHAGWVHLVGNMWFLWICTIVFWKLRPELAYIPAFVWLGLWLALQFYGLRSGGAVAWMAHLGGFFMGLLTVNLFTPLTPAPVHSKATPKRGSSKGKKK